MPDTPRPQPPERESGNSLPKQGCIHCRPERPCEYHKASNNAPALAGETPREEETAPPVDMSFLKHVTESGPSSYSEGWREVCARALWAEREITALRQQVQALQQDAAGARANHSNMLVAMENERRAQAQVKTRDEQIAQLREALKRLRTTRGLRRKQP